MTIASAVAASVITNGITAVPGLETFAAAGAARGGINVVGLASLEFCVGIGHGSLSVR